MLTRFRYWLRCAIVLLCACMPLVLPSSAEAKRRTDLNDAILEKDTSKSYALPYGLVILGVVLGVLIVARPGTRLDAPRVKVKDDEED